MGSPLGCLFGLFMAILAFLLFIVVSIVSKVRNIMSQFSPQNNKEHSSRAKQEHTGNNHTSAPHTSKTHKKVFEDNEGEYVEFEEIK